ncbi:hypothetical protein N0V88_005433 [Collariella sp. IMI 366227]|nr:hypothetical protein N0V88_005433 [Collariella sp. IMI 366227]
MARALADAGAARVYIVGRRVDVLQAAASSINRPSVIVPLYCDVTSKISLESIVSVVETDVGYLNLLVCNAGIGGPQVKSPVPGETTLEEWRAAQMAGEFEEFTNTFRVNVTIFPSEMAAPIVRASGASMEGMTANSVIPIDRSAVPLGRMGTESDMAGQILYLASRAGAYLNGNTVVVDGGRLGVFPSTGY